MQYKVPQNVQVEDKILPFMTLRQLIICAIGGGFAYVIYLSLELQPTEIWLPPVGLLTVLTLAIAFLKINDIPFIQYILYVIEHYLTENKRSWVKSAGDIFLHEVPQNSTTKKAAEPVKKKMTAADLDRLSGNLDAASLDQIKTTT